jgi:type IV secretion system protein VirB5
MKIVIKYVIVNMLIILTMGNAHGTGIPVVDAASIAKDAISWAKQVADMKLQYDQLVDEYDQAVKNYESITGIRNMADLVNNPASRYYIPAEYQDVLQLSAGIMGGDYDDLQNRVAALREGAKLLDIDDSWIDEDSIAGIAFVAAQNQIAINSALSEKAFDEINLRTNNLQTLLDKVNDAPDGKDIADLTARIAAEQAMLTNESNKLTALNQARESFWETRKQQGYERRKISLGSPDF